jgi:acyl-CoA thioesterase-1
MLLEQRFLALGYRIRVINAGKSGDTSAGLKERLEWINADAKTGDIALVVIGANDGLQGLDVQKLKDNLEDIVISLQ